MKNFKLLILMLLIVVFTLQAFACTTTPPTYSGSSSSSSSSSSSNPEDDKPVIDPLPEGPEIDGPKMSERTYQRMNEENVYAIIDEIYALLETEGNTDAIEEKREQFFADCYDKTFTMNTLASIKYDQNVNDKTWQEESVWATTFAQQLQNDTIKLEQEILSSETYGAYFVELLGQDYADSILVMETDSDEQLAVLAEIADLESQYHALYSSYESDKEDKLYSLYINLVNLRNEYAQSKTDDNGAFYANYMDYAYENIYGREYTPAEAAEFRKYVQRNLLSVRDVYAQHSGEKHLMADMDVTAAKLIEFMPIIIEDSVPTMKTSWDYMMDKGLYDFNQSINKANTSYVTSFSEYGDAFMFLNASGSLTSDLTTLIHEFGHYNEHFMAVPDWGDDSLMSYDLAETHSQAFELITMTSVGKLFKSKFPNNANIYKSYVYNMLWNSIWAILSNCVFDEFEYLVYNCETEKLTKDFLYQTFKTSWNRYWLPTVTEVFFYDIPHLFTSPAYCISYSVSMVFAAEIWASENPINNYVQVVGHGTANTLSNVCEKVGLESPLKSASIVSIKNKFKEFTLATFGWKI